MKYLARSVALIGFSLPLHATTVQWNFENPSAGPASTRINDSTGSTAVASGTVQVGTLVGVGLADTNPDFSLFVPKGNSVAFSAGFFVSAALSFDAPPAGGGNPQDPPGGTRVAFRFTDTGTGRYNTVAKTNDATWDVPDVSNLVTPDAVNFYDAGFSGPHPDLVWEDASNPFAATIPEPSTSLLGLLATSLLLIRRRK